MFDPLLTRRGDRGSESFRVAALQNNLARSRDWEARKAGVARRTVLTSQRPPPRATRGENAFANTRLAFWATTRGNPVALSHEWNCSEWPLRPNSTWQRHRSIVVPGECAAPENRSWHFHRFAVLASAGFGELGEEAGARVPRVISMAVFFGNTRSRPRAMKCE